MKLQHIIPFSLMLALLWSCNDDDMPLGAPVISYPDAAETAHFGDSLAFTVKAEDPEVALSTLKAQLFYGDDMVEETVIRTKISGQEYTGKIYLPYFANVPDGTATLRMVLQNVNFTTTVQEYPVKITHPDFPYLTLRTEDGEEYRMDKIDTDTYGVTRKFDQQLKAYIIGPKVGEFGNDIIFGYENSEVTVNAENPIPFSSARGGQFTISLNTRTFEASPFSTLKLNGNVLEAITETTASVDLTLDKGSLIVPEGFSNFGEWWIDPDWFTRNDDGSLTFQAMPGNYRIIADQKLQYFRVETLLNGAPAELQDDGSGAVWVIGEGVGKPSISANQVGWTTEKALCMAPVSDKVYRMTLVGGKTIATGSINFKFYGNMGWNYEFLHDRITSTSSDILIGDGKTHDDGNLYLADGVKLKENVIYEFTVDCTAGKGKAVLSVKEAGEQKFEEKPIMLNGVKMNTSDNVLYSLTTDLKQGASLEFSSLSDLDSYYLDPDYFSYNADNDVVTFRPVDGHYRVVLDKLNATLSAQRFDGDSPATLGTDGHGAIYILGWGAGTPNLDYQFGWEPNNAYAMAEISPCVYTFTGVAGPEKGSVTGQRLRTDYLDIKFFFQKGWGGEFSGTNQLTVAPGSKSLFNVINTGDVNLASGAQLTEGATYRITIDLSAGVSAGVISIEKL